MSRTAKSEILYGFKANIELTNEEKNVLFKNGVCESPICYTTEDDTNEYILGLKLLSCDVGQFVNIEKIMNFDKDSKKQELFKKLSDSGFDVKERDCHVYINNYYY